MLFHVAINRHNYNILTFKMKKVIGYNFTLQDTLLVDGTHLISQLIWFYYAVSAFRFCGANGQQSVV